MPEKSHQTSGTDAEQNERPATNITLLDVLRAIFTPDAISDDARWQPSVHLEDETHSLPISGHEESQEDLGDFLDQPIDYPSATAVTLAADEAQPATEAALEVGAAGRKLALVAGTTGVLLLGLLAQRSLSIRQQDTLGVTLYALTVFLWLAILYFVFGTRENRWAWLPEQDQHPSKLEPHGERPTLLQRALAIQPPRLYLAAAGLSLSALTYLATANNRFTFVGVVAWLGSIAVWIAVLSEQDTRRPLRFLRAIRVWLRRPTLRLQAEPFAFLALGVLLVAAFYRFHQFSIVPPDMTSDHVEKLLDAYDVQQGRYSVFFPRNGGREPIQMYLVATAANLFGTGISFESLKLVSALEGLALIPVVIILGKELIDRETGLVAALLLATSWWHLSLSRLGLRIVLTPLLISALLIALVRGLRTNERKYFIAVGLWLGVGVYSYQAIRIAPLVVAAGVVLAMLDPDANWRWRGRLLGNLIVAGLLALVIFVPLGRFWADSPEILWGRTITRTTSNEVAIRGSAAGIFITNLADALLMYNWRGDGAWISALPGAPLLDIVTGFLFILGMVAWWVRIVVRRNVIEALVPIAILILMLPSAMAIAFPVENPSATRASGVIPLVYLLAAWPLMLLLRRWNANLGRMGRRLALTTIGVLVIVAALFNYDIYFRQYLESYRRSGLNPREVGATLAGFSESVGSLDNAYLQGYPFWHDYRAIGIEAGDIAWDNAILDTDHLTTLIVEDPRFSNDEAKLFIVHPEDEEAQAILSDTYPEGRLDLKRSIAPERDFYIFIIPAGSQINIDVSNGEASVAE